MYIPKAFLEERPEVIAEAIRTARIGELITLGPDGLEATPIPLLLEPGGAHGTLRGHVARANPQWKHYDAALEALAVFRPTDAYVSPTFYATARDDCRAVPTWNYVTVHAWGPLTVHDDRDWVEAFVRRLTDHHEAGLDPSWSVDDAPGQFIESMLGGIVGIEIPITRVQAKRKLNQNRSEADRESVIRALETGRDSDRRIADQMRS
jgi:transcriptional regulator